MKCLILITLLAPAILAQNDNYDHDPSGDAGVPYVHNPDWDLTPFQRYKLRKAAEKGLPAPVSAPIQNEIAAAAPVALPKRVKAVRRPAPAKAATRASGLGQPTFQNFQPRNAAVPIPRPAPRQQQPVFQQPAAPRRQPQQQGALQQQAGGAFTQTAFFGQQQPQQAQQLSVFQAAPARRPAPVEAAPRRAPAVPAARFQAVPATPAVQAAPAAPVQTAQFIADSTRHPDPNFWNRAYEYQAPSYAAKAAGSSYTYVANL